MDPSSDPEFELHNLHNSDVASNTEISKPVKENEKKYLDLISKLCTRYIQMKKRKEKTS